jgi:hypothetical protein
MAEDNKVLKKLKQGALWYLGMDEKGNPDLSPDRYDFIKKSPKKILEAAKEYGDKIPGINPAVGKGIKKSAESLEEAAGYKKGGKIKKYAKGGAVISSASKRADGCARRGKTRGKLV